jgi:hypothetical protein
LGVCAKRKLRKPKTLWVFGSASVPFLSYKFFASQKTYETIAADLLSARDFDFAEFHSMKLQDPRNPP